MPQIVSNLPWLVIWVVVFLVQSYFFRKKNSFGSLILLWLTLLVGLVSVWVGSNQQKLCFSAELFDLPLSPHCFRFAVKDLAVDQMYWAAGTSIFRSSAGIVGCQTPL